MLTRIVLFAALLLFAGRSATAAVPETQIWFGMRAANTPERRLAWDRLFFQPNVVWPDALSHVNVMIVTAQALDLLSDGELASVVAGLKLRHIELDVAVLAQNWVQKLECGRGVEGYSTPAGNANVIAKLQRVGASVSYIGMDEPLFFGHYYNGKNACHSSIDNVAERVAVILNGYLKAFPNAAIVDSEAFPAISDHPGWQGDYKSWLLAVRSAVGRPIWGLNIDINWPPQWQQVLASVVTFARDQGLSVGIFYWARAERGSGLTNEAWLNNSVRNFTEIEQGMRIVPDRALFTSWVRFPERTVTDASGLGEDYLIQQYLLMKNRR